MALTPMAVKSGNEYETYVDGMSRNIKNGETLTIVFGGGSSGGGGGLPPGSQDPPTSSENGPYKVYAGTISIGGLTSGQEGGSNLSLMAAIS